MRLGPLGASLFVHGLLMGLLLVPATGAVRQAPSLPMPTPNVTMALVDLAKLQAKPLAPPTGTIQYPRKKKHLMAKVAPKPTIVKVAAKPTPRPSPLPKPNQDERKIFEALRKADPSFAKMTDDQIRKLPLPPGMKSWADVLAMTGNLDKLDWTHAPPDTVDKTAASASAGGFFGWAPPNIKDDAVYMGALKREEVNGTWHFTFQYFGSVLVAEWQEGETVAKVAYYPINGKPEAAKTFSIAVATSDEDLAAEMQAQFGLISQGLPPAPVPTASSATR